MERCPSCQAQLLEYVYDLLEPAERQAVDEHLKACPACQAALVKVRGQQRLLAAAAKTGFPDVRFAAPAEPAAVVATVEPLPVRRPAWRRWAVAAALLLVAAGLGAPGYRMTDEYLQARHLVEEKEKAMALAQKDFLTVQQQQSRLPQERQAKIEEVRKTIRDSQVQVMVTGPASVQPGAPAEYQVQAQNLDGQPVKAQVRARVMDGDRQVTEVTPAPGAAQGVYRLVLPPDLPVKPNSQLTLLVAARRDSGTQTELSERLELVAPTYVTHLTTDKPMYQLGEVVHFRSLTLNRFSLKPPEEDFNLDFVITTPKGEESVILQGSTRLTHGDAQAGPAGGTVLGPDGKPVRGVGTGEYSIDPGAPGGEYTLTVREANQRFPEQKRKFLVNAYQKPRLEKELDYSRKTYGPGEEVLARCKARGEAGPVKNRPVEATITIDDKHYDANGKESPNPVPFQTDAEGVVLVRFKLPAAIERGQASLSVKFNDGANVEAIVRPIPLVLKKLVVEFFPEGGDLVAGLPNRVYFQVRTPLGKPADLEGVFLDNGQPVPGPVVVQTETDAREPGVNQGMGSFQFTPRAGHTYELEVKKPVGIAERFGLPKAKDSGVVLSIPQGVVRAGQPIPVRVQSTGERSLLVGAYCRGRLLDSIQLPPGKTEALLKPASDVGGVCRVTVFEERETDRNRRVLVPVAERLIYRQPAEELHLVINPDRSAYVPGQKANLSVRALNEKEEPAPALVTLAVVDQSVVKLADDKTARSMPTHFLLTTEVRRPEDLEYADFLLGPHPRAARALDLLLGTQGWRRFAEQDPDRFRQNLKEEAERLLVTIGQSGSRTTDFAQEQVEKVEKAMDERAAALAVLVQEAQGKVQQAAADPDLRAARATLVGYEQLGEKARRTWLPLAAIVLVLASLAWVVVSLFHKGGRVLPYLGLAASCCLLVLAGRNLLENVRVAKDGPRMAQATAPATETTTRMPPAPMKMDAVNADKDGQGFGGGGPPPLREAPPAPAMAPAPAAAALGRAAGRGGEKGPGNGPDANALGAEEGKMAKGERALDDRTKQKELLLREQEQVQPQFKGRMVAERKVADAKKNGVELQLRRAAPAGRPMAAAVPVAPMGGMGGMRGAPGPGQPAAPEMDQLRDGKAKRAELIQSPPLVVRQYAHQRPAGATPEMRSDFTETLYWNPVLVLPDGKAEVSFDLCDSVTTFQAVAFAHTLDGRIGAVTRTFDSRLPFTLQPKTPLEVTAGDKIDVPLSIANNTDEARTVSLDLEKHQGLELLSGKASDQFSVAPGARVRKLYHFQPTLQEGEATLVYKGKTQPFAADSNLQTFRIVPQGFPVVVARSDMLEKSASDTLVLPDTWVKGTLKCQVQVYPSTLADLQKGLESLLREPGGCFEQTSTSNYPNILILDYLKESNQAKPEVERQARDMLARGYQRLTSFECPSTPKKAREGFEWFGAPDQGHEALTAYGLLQFRDLARVQEVDPALLQRTRQFLLARRDGHGGFQRNPQAIDTFGRAPQDITDAYIVWALTEGGKDDDVTKELNALYEKAKSSKDPYFLALVANGLLNRSRTEDGLALLKTLIGAQKEDGHLDAERTSITASGGRDLQIETTALTVLGWLKANNPGLFNVAVQKAVRWIGQQRGGYGGFGSTQSTILALKALIAFTRANKKTAESGELQLFVGDQRVAGLAFAASVTEPLTLTLPDPEKHLHAGKNPVRVEISGKNVFPYTLSWSYQTLQPASAEACPVRLETGLAKTEAREGDVVRLKVGVRNASGKGQGMAVAILGLPGGLTLPEDMKQLKEYTRIPEGGRPLVDAFEVRGRELVLYWRDLAPDRRIEVPIDLTCRVPGEYTGPASRAYLYYNADHKHWVEPLKIAITAKEE